MTNAEIKHRILMTVDQFYKSPPGFIENAQSYYVGGILQTALHLLSTNEYFNIKKYIYEVYGYDPGGVAEQFTIYDYEEEQL